MAATKAVAIGRSLLTFRSSSSHLVTMRLFSSSSSIAGALPLPGFSRPVRATVSLSHYLRLFAPGAVCLNAIRCCVNHSGDAYPLNFRRYIDDPLSRKAKQVFPGCDFEHWLIMMDKPGGERATKQQMIQCYVETLANVLGSEEEAKEKIYSVSCEGYFAFGCQIDEETSNKLQELPGVLSTLPDSYVDPENEDYGGELFVNGEIVQRLPERQKRLELLLKSGQDNPDPMT